MAEVRRFAQDAGLPAQPPPVSYAPEDVMTLRFTSGSTGLPKAIAPTADSVDACLRAVQEMFRHGPGDDIFCFLPLSLQQQRFWVYSAMCFGHDVAISTYEAAFAALPRARPTVVMGVPGFFETAKKHIEAAAGGDQGGEPPRQAARRLFGDRIRYLWTGSAPASTEMLRFFNSCGLPIYEGYGLNEACIVSKNYPGANKVGSAGRLLRGTRVTFDADGVMSVHSDHPVTSRYEIALPGDSERVFAGPGVVRTSDVGYLDEDGYLFIRGRADDVIVLDNGRKIIVRPIEEHMKGSPAIQECVLYCPTQTYLVAVVSPAQQPADQEAIAARLADCNARFGADEQISRVVVARPPFSIGNDLLTNQFKPRRKHVFDAYRAEILGSKADSHAH
jgi:long-subunit acyl-CoA synthetase (AMP-forming)